MGKSPLILTHCTSTKLSCPICSSPCVLLLELERLAMLPCPIWYGQVLALIPHCHKHTYHVPHPPVSLGVLHLRIVAMVFVNGCLTYSSLSPQTLQLSWQYLLPAWRISLLVLLTMWLWCLQQYTKIPSELECAFLEPTNPPHGQYEAPEPSSSEGLPSQESGRCFGSRPKFCDPLPSVPAKSPVTFFLSPQKRPA